MSQLEVNILRYQSNDRLAIQILEDGAPFCTLSTNVEEVPLEDNEFIVNHDILGICHILKVLLESNFSDTGKRCSYGYCHDVPIWKWNG